MTKFWYRVILYALLLLPIVIVMMCNRKEISRKIVPQTAADSIEVSIQELATQDSLKQVNSLRDTL